VLTLIAMAIAVGLLGVTAAWMLSKLISLASNLAYYGRWT
jgi:hypothetical protein